MFYSDFNRFGQKIAAIEGEEKLTYQQLEQRCELFAKQLDVPTKSLFLIPAQNSICTLISYLTVIRLNHCAMLISPDLSDAQLDHLCDCYQPSAIIDRDKDGFPCVTKLTINNTFTIATDVSLLLATSGSTGSPKFVALSNANLQANAHSICQYLPIDPCDNTITTLPFFYSYGLSVINSHLLAGACIVFTQHSVLSREFWTLFKNTNINSLAGVPYTFEMLLRLRFERMTLPSLRYFTQAGGKLDEDKIRMLAEYADSCDISFFLMYGQTEATARIAFLSSKHTKDKPHAIGRAIPGGELYLRNENGDLITDQGQQGELFYRGPNVMLGYVSSYADLHGFSALLELATGDLAFQDEDGDFVICGRLKRIIKLFGHRINLDDVEALLSKRNIECYCTGTDLQLIIGVNAQCQAAELKKWLSEELRINHRAIIVKELQSLPLTSSGKKDYSALMKMIKSE